MESLLEVDDGLATLAEAVGNVLADLPVHGSLEGVLDGLRTTLDEEEVGELRRHGHTLERRNELRHLNGVDVGVGGVIKGNLRTKMSQSNEAKRFGKIGRTTSREKR